MNKKFKIRVLNKPGDPFIDFYIGHWFGVDGGKRFVYVQEIFDKISADSRLGIIISWDNLKVEKINE